MAALPPKKRFGQHFLKEPSIARRIAECLQLYGKAYDNVLEIGPGHGVLTQFLHPLYLTGLHLVEIDTDLVPILKQKFPDLKDRIIQKDFLQLNLDALFSEPFAIIGNFPYNISSQILFKIVDHRAHIPEAAGMFQREVAQRVCAPPGSKIYGLLSAWLQTFYETEYLFTVSEGCFNPPPKVKSGVLRITRRPEQDNMPDPTLHLSIIKAAFGQRRKTLRNALRPFEKAYPELPEGVLDARAETLGWEQYLELARIIEKVQNARL